MKLFIHEILPPTVKRTIFIDTDAFFISDPLLLWQQFDTFSPVTAISMPSHPEQSSEEWHNANRICSCIMLLDLERLRTLRLMDSEHYRAAADGRYALAPAAFEALFGKPSEEDGKYKDVKLGDQGYWWAIVSYRQDLFRHLPYDWEVSSCLLDMYMTGLGHDDATEEDEAATHVHTWDTPHQGQAVLPKMLHLCVFELCGTLHTSSRSLTVMFLQQLPRWHSSLLRLGRLGRPLQQPLDALERSRPISCRFQVDLAQPSEQQRDETHKRDRIRR